MKNKQLHYILFRLFWDDKPVGFEYWAPETGTNYTCGKPETLDGHHGWGWSGTKVNHNRKEILNIEYVTKEYIQKKKEKDEFFKNNFNMIRDNLNIINHIREESGYKKLTL